MDAFYIDGIQHNIPFLTAVMQNPRWRSGALSTGFIKEEYPEGFKGREPEGNDLKVLAAIGAVIDHANNDRRRGISHQMTGQPVVFAKQRVVKVGGAALKLEVSGTTPGPYTVSFLDAGGKKTSDKLELNSPWWPGDPVWQGRVGKDTVVVQVRTIPNGVNLAYRGIQAPTYVYTQREFELAGLMLEKAGADMSKFLLCPMPGLVKAISVAEGAEVKAGDNLAVVEAMKMENVLRAERDGKVKKINAKAGDSLAVDAVILEFA